MLHRHAFVAGGEGEKKKQQRYKTTRISNEECKRLLRALDKLMKTRKPYTNPELKLADLAAMVDTSAHALSFLFNQYMNKSYYDYVNQYRVEEFIDLAERTDVTRYTLSAMAAKCGFSSRASFFRYFKNITGITPAEYLKKRL
ncbi:MAG: helix-turn-helix domain-containing protein [Muribaculaceae bacterium]|nr:helix-turn-helix domain-containing protein [Muribaculaceae bacterium]